MDNASIKAKCQMYIGSILVHCEQFGHDKINIMKAGDMAHADPFLADVLGVVRKVHNKTGKTNIRELSEAWVDEHGGDEMEEFTFAICECALSVMPPKQAQDLEEDIRACVA